MRSLLRAVALGLGFMLAATAAFADYESELYAKAKKEGELVWYTTLIVKQAVRPIVAAFREEVSGRQGALLAGQLVRYGHQDPE